MSYDFSKHVRGDILTNAVIWVRSKIFSPLFVGWEIGAIFLSSIKQQLEIGYTTSTCSDSGIQQLRDTLREGHTEVPGLRIYALFAVSDVDVTERAFVLWVIWYNNHCAAGKKYCFFWFRTVVIWLRVWENDMRQLMGWHVHGWTWSMLTKITTILYLKPECQAYS